MADGEPTSKVTTESSQAVLRAVAGRLSKIDAGELPTIQYVGPDGNGTGTIAPNGQISHASPVASDQVEAQQYASMPAPPTTSADPRAPAAPSSGEPTAKKPGFFARLFAKFHRSDG